MTNQINTHKIILINILFRLIFSSILLPKNIVICSIYCNKSIMQNHNIHVCECVRVFVCKLL